MRAAGEKIFCKRRGAKKKGQCTLLERKKLRAAGEIFLKMWYFWSIFGYFEKKKVKTIKQGHRTMYKRLKK